MGEIAMSEGAVTDGESGRWKEAVESHLVEFGRYACRNALGC